MAGQTALDAFGRLDGVVHAARSAEPAVEDFEVDTFRFPVETNLFGFVYVTQAVLPILRMTNQEGNDPGSDSRLILSIAEMAEAPIRLVVGSDATQHLTDTGQALAGLEAKWRN